MRFTQPTWLLAGLLAVLGTAALWRLSDVRQQAALARFVAAHLRRELTQSLSKGRRRLQRGLFLAAVALLFTALAGPQLGYRWEQITRRGNEIVFAIDTSRSMTTPDIKPDRLGRAKLAIDDFIKQLDGDAVGIVAFAGSAFLDCPITLDYGAVHESLAAIDTNTIPRGGTNISSAIREAQAALRRRPGSDKILILVSDGEDLEGSAIDTAKAAKQEDGLRIFTVGVGSAGGDLIPIPADQGGGFVKDADGAFVKSRLDETALKAIAAAADGFYVPLGTQGEGLESLYQRVLGPMAKHDLASRQQKIYTERFQWPLSASFGLMLLSLTIGNRRRTAARSNVSNAALSRAAAVLAAALLGPLAALAWCAVSASAAHADTLSAADAYKKGDFAGAEQGYAAAAKQDPGKPALQYNLGAAEYRAGKFPQAAEAFQQSIVKSPGSNAKNLADQEDAYYNLGNSLYRAGQKSEQSAPQEALKQWTDAVKAYETALQMHADDADSKYNRDLVKRKIEQLKQNQNQNQNQNDKNNQNKNNQDKNQGQNQQDPKQQGQNSPQGNGQGQGQPPQGQPPQGQPPGQQPGQPPPQNANNNDPKQGQAPPQQDPGSKDGQQPPPAPNEPPRKGQAKNNPDDQAADDDQRTADDEHAPGEMSREEARELLDSVKGDERRAPPGALNRQDSQDEPQQPVKNW